MYNLHIGTRVLHIQSSREPADKELRLADNCDRLVTSRAVSKGEGKVFSSAPGRKTGMPRQRPAVPCRLRGTMDRILNQRGFTFLTAIMMVIIIGISLGAVGVSWRVIMQREREEELLFRGSQIRDAIASWYGTKTGDEVATPLTDLKDLLKDPRTPHTVRHLRRLYTDPITNKEWTLITDPVKGIQGVASASQDTPLKKDGFPEDLQDFTGKTRYSDWRFVYTPSRTAPVSSGGPGVLPPGTAADNLPPSPTVP